MKRYSKVFKNRQVLTSGEMNDIVDVINDIISQFNDSNGSEGFEVSVYPKSIIRGTITPVTVSVDKLNDPNLDPNKIKIYSSEDAFFKEHSNGKTFNIGNTTTFKVTVPNIDTGKLHTQMITVYATSPVYIVSGKSLVDVVEKIRQDEVEPREDSEGNKFTDSLYGEFGVDILKGEDIYLVIPESIKFDPKNIYLDSIVFPVKKLEEEDGVTPEIQEIKNAFFKFYKSSGGEEGFTKSGSIILEIIPED